MQRFFCNRYFVAGILFLVVLRVWFAVNPDQFKETLRLIPFLPDSLVNTIRFFPDYNPFSEQLDDKLPSFGQPVDLTGDVTELKTKSMLVKLTLPFPGSGSREVLVYVPQGYDPRAPARRYPVLYLLHGSPGLASDWVEAAGAWSTLDTAIAAKRISPLIAVFPDGNGGANRDTEFINSADGKERNEDFLVQTVVEAIDRNFLTLADPEYRAIGGASSGGFGALNLGLKHQDVFGYILSFSGYGRIDQTPLTSGTIQGSQTVIHENSPLDYIPALQTKTIRTLLLSESKKSAVDDNQEIRDLLIANGFQAEQKSFEGKHTYKFWGEHLPDALDWLRQYWSSDPSAL